MNAPVTPAPISSKNPRRVQWGRLKNVLLVQGFCFIQRLIFSCSRVMAFSSRSVIENEIDLVVQGPGKVLYGLIACRAAGGGNRSLRLGHLVTGRVARKNIEEESVDQVGAAFGPGGEQKLVGGISGQR